MSAVQVLAQGGITDDGIRAAGAFIAGGLALAGGAIGAANGNAQVGAAMMHGVARQPEAAKRLSPTMFLIISLCEAAYFINVAFMATFVFVLA